MQNSSYVGICTEASELLSASWYVLSMLSGVAPLAAKLVNYSRLYKLELEFRFGAKTALDV
jgi:hypothetical protein